MIAYGIPLKTTIYVDRYWKNGSILLDFAKNTLRVVFIKSAKIFFQSASKWQPFLLWLPKDAAFSILFLWIVISKVYEPYSY